MVSVLNMDDPALDILDRRGRMRRLVIAATIGVVVAALVLPMLTSSSAPSGDPISSASVIIVGVGLFLSATAIALAVTVRISRRLARRLTSA
jgi:hypothetical protein